MEENIIVIRDPFCFNFDRPKYVDENLKHEIDIIIKTNELIEIEQSLSKYKHGNNIHEHGKQQNE